MNAPFVLVDDVDLAGAPSGTAVTLSTDSRHHLGRVLRRRDGDALVLADGRGHRVDARLDGDVAVTTSDVVEEPRHRPRLVVWQALGKGRKHDEVVRALTELGVDEIVAVTSERTVTDLVGPRADKARARWTAVARSAAEQARRARLPDVAGPHALDDLVAGLDGRPCLVAHVGATQDPLGAAAGASAADEVVLAVGPEGGWTDGEVAALTAAGGQAVSLGTSVLRTEHAAVVLAAVVGAAQGRMSG